MSLTTTKILVGILGGTFDPPHNAHVQLAHAALAVFALDECRIIPTGNPYHRQPTSAPATARLDMAQLAFGDVPGCTVDDREVQSSAPSYTLNTLQSLHAEQPDAALLLILGMDTFLGLPQWHEWESVFRYAHIAVAQRAHLEIDPGTMPAPLAEQFSRRFTQDVSTLPQKTGGAIVSLAMPPMPVSATQIRTLLASDNAADRLALRQLLPAAVLDYIESSNLYRRSA
jgi:nicotinate-nucleotide adenylyltransferase